MPKVLFDEEGNEYEVPTEEELQSLQEKAKVAETLEAEKTTLQKQIEEKENEFKKFKSVNQSEFTNLKNKTKEEIEVMRGKLEGEQRVMFDELVEMRREREEEKAYKKQSWEEKILKSIAGEDETFKTKLKDIEKSYVGEPKTYDELAARYTRAYREAVGNEPDINPMNVFYPTGTAPSVNIGKRDFTKTPAGKALLREIGWEK